MNNNYSISNLRARTYFLRSRTIRRPSSKDPKSKVLFGWEVSQIQNLVRAKLREDLHKFDRLQLSKVILLAQSKFKEVTYLKMTSN